MRERYILSAWKGRSEDDLLRCLEEGFSTEFEVLNFHKLDRAHENGVDLQCLSHDKTINIQTKIKPGTGDVPQLQKLSLSHSDRRIYAYVGGCSVSFRKKMREYPEVEFWKEGELHPFLVKNQSKLYLRFLFLGTSLAQCLMEVLKIILHSHNLKPKRLEKEHLSDWWRLKDRAVMVHSGVRLLSYKYREIISAIWRHDPEEFEKILGDLFDSLEMIENFSGKDLVTGFKKVRDEGPSLLSGYLKLALKASNWMGAVRALQEFSDEVAFTKLLEVWIVPQENATIYSETMAIVDNLKDIAEAIEDGIDWLFYEYLKGNDNYASF